MIKEAVFHINRNDFIYPTARNQLTVKLRTAAQDIKKCKIIYWPRTDKSKTKALKMNWKYRDKLYDYFQTTLTFSRIARYQQYYFSLEDSSGQTWYYSMAGISRQKPENNWFEYLYANSNDIVSVPKWTAGAVYYHIFPERFCDGDSTNNPKDCLPWGSIPTRTNYMGGDLQGIISKIGYLSELGIDCVYINPIFEADFNHKYATKNYYKIDPQFGSNQLFKELVTKYHKRGIRIILDGVFNHTGISFPPFADLLKMGKNSKYKDWFLIEQYPVKITHHNYECVGAYKWMPKLNSSLSDVRTFIINVMEYWIKEYDIDGWRLDVADEVDLTVWQEASMILREKYPDIILLGETWQYGGELLSNGRLDSVMNYMFRDSVRDYFGYEKISASTFDQQINHMLALYREEQLHSLYNLLDSHDTERFLWCCSNDKRKFMTAIAFQFLFIGSPAVFYGDEIGITGDNDPDCRQCMIWNSNYGAEIREWYKTLIKIRKQYPAVREGDYCTILVNDFCRTFGFIRQKKEQRIYVVICCAKTETEVLCPVINFDQNYTDLIENCRYLPEKCNNTEKFYNADQIQYEGKLRLVMSPYSVKVICEEEKDI